MEGFSRGNMILEIPLRGPYRGYGKFQVNKQKIGPHDPAKQNIEDMDPNVRLEMGMDASDPNLECLETDNSEKHVIWGALNSSFIERQKEENFFSHEGDEALEFEGNKDYFIGKFSP